MENSQNLFKFRRSVNSKLQAELAKIGNDSTQTEQMEKSVSSWLILRRKRQD